MKFFCLIAFAIPVSLSGALAQTADSTRVRTAPTATYQMNQPEIQQAVGMAAAPGSTLRNVRTFDTRYEGLHGTPYLLPEWNKGQVELLNGQRYQNVPIKFNAYRQEVVVLRPQFGNDSITLNKEQVKSFQFASNTGQLYLFRRFPTLKTDDAVAREGYSLVLYEGKSALLKRIVKTFKKADYKGGYSTDVRYDEFNPIFSYYLLKPDQTLTKVKLSDKSIIESFGDHADELRAFVKQEKLNFKDENDAIQLVKKYDSL